MRAWVSHEAAAAGVHKDHAVLHLGDGLVVDHVTALLVEEGVQRDEVGAAVELVVVHVLVHDALLHEAWLG